MTGYNILTTKASAVNFALPAEVTMGNGQSAVENPCSRRAPKSKRVPAERSSEGSSPVSKYDTPSPLSSGVPYSQYNASETVVGSPMKQTVELNQESRQHIRSQLLSPEEYDPTMETGRENEDVLAASLARSLSRSRSHRAREPTLQDSASKLNKNTSQMSLSSDRTVDLDTAVALLQELRKTASPEDLVALHRALLPTRSNDPLSNPADAVEGRFSMSAAGLIRRKSLAQPGVATRHAKNQPEVKQENAQLWKPPIMGTSSLARLSRYDDLEPDLQLPQSIAQDRAHTPTGDEYSNLGNLKRGSLMVMNGAASPAPSFISREFLGKRQSEDKYFTASENGSGPASPIRALPALPIPSAQHPLDSSGRTREDFRFSDQQERSTALSTQRSGSPLKREVRARSPIWELDGETTLMTREPRTQPSAISLIAKSENHSLFSNMSSVEDFRAHQSHLRTASQSAISLAAEYIMELPPSPHKTTDIGKERLPAESLPNSSRSRPGLAYENPYNVSQDTQHESWESTQMPLFGQTQVGDEILAQTALRSHPPNVFVPLKSALKNRRSSQAKTDSGYCSSVSTGVEAGQMIEMDPLNLSTVDSVAAAAPKGDVAPIPTVESEKSACNLATSRPQADVSERWPASYKVEGDNGQETPGESERPKTERRKSWRKSIRRSLSRSRTTEITPDKKSPASTPGSSLSLESTKSKKLQKKRPHSQPPLKIRDSHDLKGEVPRVPSSTWSKFSERVAISPGLQHLDRTHEDATRNNTRRGPANPAPAPGASPVLEAADFPDAQRDNATITASHTLKQVTPVKGAPKPPRHRHGIPRLSFRRASTSKREEEEIGSDGITEVADFGTVAKSLGSGPYDIAKGSQPHQPRSALAGPVRYPHQLGADQGQYGPREGWDAETASKFAQMRSRERAAATAAAERGSVVARKPTVPNRPRSYHEDSPTQQSQQPNMDRRPKTVHGSVPKGQGYMQKQVQVDDQHPAQREYLRAPALITTTSALRPRTADANSVANQGLQQQGFHRSRAVPRTPRPRTANSEPVVDDHRPRSESPVKNMVGLLEARAALALTPSPRLAQSPSSSVDWSEQSRLWRETKLNAKEGVRTTSSEYSESVTSTTTSTMVTYVGGSHSQPGHPAVQTSYSSTPTTTTRTVHGTLPTTTTTHTSYLSTPVSRTNNSHSTTVSSTTSSRISQTPIYSRMSTPTQPRSREQSRVQPQSQYNESPISQPSSSPAQPQPQPQSTRIRSGSIIGRFGGGFIGERVGLGKPSGSGRKRDVAPRTQAIRSGYGVDFGDIPMRNAPI